MNTYPHAEFGVFMTFGLRVRLEISSVKWVGHIPRVKQNRNEYRLCYFMGEHRFDQNKSDRVDCYSVLSESTQKSQLPKPALALHYFGTAFDSFEHIQIMNILTVEQNFSTFMLLQS